MYSLYLCLSLIDIDINSSLQRQMISNEDNHICDSLIRKQRMIVLLNCRNNDRDQLLKLELLDLNYLLVALCSARVKKDIITPLALLQFLKIFLTV